MKMLEINKVTKLDTLGTMVELLGMDCDTGIIKMDMLRNDVKEFYITMDDIIIKEDGNGDEYLVVKTYKKVK